VNIQDIRQKVKKFRDAIESREVYTAILIVLVGLTAFGLGRLSLLESKTQGIRVSDALPFESAQTASALVPVENRTPEASEQGALETVLPSGGQVVASKSGSKYHYPWCSGAQRIAEANKVWFDSIEIARKAGYAPAGNCKGLR